MTRLVSTFPVVGANTVTRRGSARPRLRPEQTTSRPLRAPWACGSPPTRGRPPRPSAPTSAARPSARSGLRAGMPAGRHRRWRRRPACWPCRHTGCRGRRRSGHRWRRGGLRRCRTAPRPPGRAGCPRLARRLGGQPQREVALELRVGFGDCGGQAVGVVGQVGHGATGHSLCVDRKPAVGGPVQPPVAARVGAGGHRAGRPGEQARLDPEGLGLLQVRGRTRLGDPCADLVRRQDVGERHHDPVGGHRQRDIRPTGSSTVAVVLVPLQAMGDLELVGASGDLVT